MINPIKLYSLNEERNHSIDFIKFFAILFIYLFIIIIHANPFKGTDVWVVNDDNIDFILDTLGGVAVSSFFMTSGYLWSWDIDVSACQKQTCQNVSFTMSKKPICLRVQWVVFCLMPPRVVKENDCINPIQVIGLFVWWEKDVFQRNETNEQKKDNAYIGCVGWPSNAVLRMPKS